jgi:isopentenyl diphosphate isomerase/L-lactate dehydrogenase-like FMN-dependent dehydrogenase
MRDKEMVESIIHRAENAGYTALVITLDTKLLGWREYDLESAYLPFLEGKGIANYTSDPVFRSRLEKSPEEDMQGAVAHWSTMFSDPAHTWEDLKHIVDTAKIPVVLKGIVHPDDARLAVEAGVQGIIVSNHGGRQVDGAIGALEALPGIVDAVGDKLTIGFDSGIRHGADIVKALALGAKFCCLGRPYSYGLAVGGETGVKEVIQRFLADYDLTMALAGFTRPGDLSRDILVDATSTSRC